MTIVCVHQTNAPIHLEVFFIHDMPLFPLSQLTALEGGWDAFPRFLQLCPFLSFPAGGRKWGLAGWETHVSLRIEEETHLHPSLPADWDPYEIYGENQGGHGQKPNQIYSSFPLIKQT